MTPSLVLHNNLLSFVIHSSCISCLPFMLLFIWQELCRYIQLATVLVIKTLSNSTQVHRALPRLVDTCWLLEDILTQDEYGHFHANNKTSHLFFYYSFINYLAPLNNFLSSDNCPSFISLCFCSCVSYFTPLSTTKTHRHLLVIWRYYKNESFIAIFT